MRFLSLVAVTFAMSLGVSIAQAQDFGAMSCEELWWERNSVYKQAGYCFKTARAIRAFGNAGCRFDEMGAVPLSGQDQRIVREVQGWEDRRRCPR